MEAREESDRGGKGEESAAKMADKWLRGLLKGLRGGCADAIKLFKAGVTTYRLRWTVALSVYTLYSIHYTL
jgi:hypothetical protein